jgi:hypothetical protein
MASPILSDNCIATLQLYLNFIRQMKAENPQMNVLEVNYSKNRQGGNTSSDKRGSAGISDGEVADRFMRNTSTMPWALNKRINPPQARQSWPYGKCTIWR